MERQKLASVTKIKVFKCSFKWHQYCYIPWAAIQSNRQNTVQVFRMRHRAAVTVGRKRCQSICQECQSHVAALCQGSVSRALHLHPRWRDEWEWSAGSARWLPEKDRGVKSGEISKTSFNMACSRNFTPKTTFFVIFHKGLPLRDALIFSEFKMRWW